MASATGIFFGAARSDSGNKTPGYMVGTAGRMAPEMVNSFVYSSAADVYGLGAALHEMITTAPPFSEEHLGYLAEKYKKSYQPHTYDRTQRWDLLLCISEHGEVPSVGGIRDATIARIIADCYSVAEARPTAPALGRRLEAFYSSQAPVEIAGPMYSL